MIERQLTLIMENKPGALARVVGLFHQRGYNIDSLHVDPIEDFRQYAFIEDELNIRKVSFEKLLQISDIVSVHVPLSEKTIGLFSKKEFSLMKNNSIFINTCRGPVHDEKSLIDALKNNEILGAGLDVTEIEPISKNSELLRLDNCVVTPHLAGSSKESVDRRIIFAFENARKTLMGIKPENII